MTVVVAIPRELLLALRQLRRARGALVTLTMAVALSVGTNVAVAFLVYHELRPATLASDPDRLFIIRTAGGGTVPPPDSPDVVTDLRLSLRDYADLAAEPGAFQTIGGFNADTVAVMTGADRGRSVCRVFVLPGTLDALGVRPAMGRSLDARDFEPNALPVTLLGYEVWQRYFLADPEIVGRSIRLDDQPFTVAGVLPRGVADLVLQRRALFDAASPHLCLVTPFVPGLSGYANRLHDYLRGSRDAPWLHVVGRLCPEATESQAAAQLQSRSAVLRSQSTTRTPAWALRLTPFRSWHTGPVRPVLLLLAAAAFLTILVAVSNVSALITAETARRANEFGLRFAVGARFTSLAAVIVLRGFLWCLPGAVVGTLCAVAIVNRLRSPAVGTLTAADQLGELAVFFLPGALTITIVLIAAGVAARQLRESSLVDSLRQGGQWSSGSGRRLVAAFLLFQTSAGVSLALGSAVLIRTMWTIAGRDPGFDRERGFIVELRVPRSRYPDLLSQREFYGRALARVQAVQGIAAAGISSSPPLASAASSISGAALVGDDGTRRLPGVLAAQFVTAGYFEALGVRLLRGRFLTLQDERERSGIVVDESFWRRHLTSGDSLSTSLRFGRDTMAIVGVVANTGEPGGTLSPDGHGDEGTVFLPFSAFTSAPTWAFLVARLSSSDARAMDAVVRDVAAIDPSVLVGDPVTFTSLLARRFATHRRLTVLFTMMTIVILLLAATSISAALHEAVSMRTNEIAVRYCLGANARQIALLMLKSIGLPASAGLALGTLFGVLFVRVLSSSLEGVATIDLSTSTLVVLLSAMGGLMASVAPIRRALRVNPASIVRHE
jgi:putative ABC transport system permease protein